MKVTTLKANTFISNPQWGYASYIFNREQLRICHCHDYYEIFIVSRGHAVHCVNGASISITTGDLLMMRPNDVHYYDQPSSKFRIINMIVTVSVMEELFAYLGSGFDKERLLTPTLPPGTHIELDALEELLADFEQLVVSKKIMREKSDTFFRIVLFRLMVTCFPNTPVTKTNSIPQWLHWLTLEMQKKENFKEGLPALYRLSKRSEEHVSRMCRKHLNKTPTQLINEIRIDYATKLLLGTSMSATAVSERVGFESLSHFYHLFKEHFGVAPNQFRKNAASMSIPGSAVITGLEEKERTILEGMPFEV